jgi:hypothetical protein
MNFSDGLILTINKKPPNINGLYDSFGRKSCCTEWIVPKPPLIPVHDSGKIQQQVFDATLPTQGPSYPPHQGAV